MSDVRTGARALFFVLLFSLCCTGGKCEIQKPEAAASTTFPDVKPFHNEINEPQAFPDAERASLPVFTMDYPRIQVPFEFTLWVLLASFAKIGTSGSEQHAGFVFVHLCIVSSSLQDSTSTIKSQSGSRSPAS